MTPTADRRVDADRLRRAVYDSAAAEVATASGNRPETFPLSPFYDGDDDTVVVTSPPAFSGKVDSVRENPQLSVLFYDAGEPFLLRGRGTVHDDDLEANAEYVQQLIAAEPDSPKKDAFSGTSSLLESRIGRFFFGWYALRVVVEIEPVAVEAVDADAGRLPAWPEQGVDPAEAGSYDRLAFTVVDGEGWPTTRTVADVELDGDAALLDVPGSVEEGQPGCLLCHWHTPGVEKLGQRLFRGRCRPAGDRVAFEPASSFSMRNETWLDRLKFVVEGKRRTRAYFRKRSG
ncbi:pyridoxamine 5'-phosphate oxidase family protein [Natronomonas marina]|jgi:hypothetical protein|uniref:pyridoxamine 5'-phosphate oxidase family protein n=1 Tax=Natronomonas marina TaxID=2961939 RepID=UPI0020C9B988|nr:pyridoxamine 5'-phosphate oxidase family protein [Natronomonas marina]